MKKTILLVLATMLFSATIVSAMHLPSIGNTEKNMFKNLVQGYIHPYASAWGIALNTEKDSYLVAKIYAATVRTLPRNQIQQIIKDAREGNETSWSGVIDKIKAAINANSTNVTKGRIQINNGTYILTNVSKTETTFTADIRMKPNYSACASTNVSAEDCENNSTKLGDMSLTRKNAESTPEKHRVWAGTMDFQDVAYTFVALVNPRVGG